MNSSREPDPATGRFVGVGCGALVGAAFGVVVAVRVTFMWVRPGEWYEWPVVGTIVLFGAALVAWMTVRHGRF